jgi:6-phosphogluconate dehydrogenase
MEIGLVGLGRMGGNMTRRLIRAGHRVVVHDRSPAHIEAFVKEGAVGAPTWADFARALKPPRTVWMMLPAAVVDSAVDAIAPVLGPGDTLIDGGNSYYKDDLRRSAALRGRGLHYLDVGVSGGVWGLERGYCLMIGGDAEPVLRLTPIFEALAPGIASAPRSPTREGPPDSAEQGYYHCGPSGAGHFVKMVHNGIEYGLMAAYAEGLNLLRHANIGAEEREADAETTPLREPEAFRYDFDLREITELWRRGSVVASWLLDLTAEALDENPDLSGFGGHVSDSGEGRWTVEAAIEAAVPVPVLASALFERFSSRGEADFADQILSAMRSQFGGHAEKPATGS